MMISHRADSDTVTETPSSYPGCSVQSLCTGLLDNTNESVSHLSVSPLKMRSTGGTIRTWPSGADTTYDVDAWCVNHVNFTSELWNLTSDEHAKLEELGRRMVDIQHFKNRPSDAIRFLKQAFYNVDHAETMFRSMITWRLENKVDTLLEDYKPPTTIFEYFPYSVLQGVDKEGDPILVGRSGATDGASMLERYGMAEMMKYSIWCREMVWHGPWIRQYEAEYQRPVKWITIIDDAHELQIVQHISNRPLIKSFGEIIQMDKENYPQPAKLILLIRAPALVPMLWSIVKIFFHSGVVKKLQFFNNKNYQKGLAKVMDLEVLPDDIVPGIGKGHARVGFPPKFSCGPLPPNALTKQLLSD